MQNPRAILVWLAAGYRRHMRYIALDWRVMNIQMRQQPFTEDQVRDHLTRLLTEAKDYRDRALAVEQVIPFAPGSEYRELKRTFIVFTDGKWGRGHSLNEAADACKRAGAAVRDVCSAYLILGDSSAEMNANGRIIYDQSEVTRLYGTGLIPLFGIQIELRLGALL